MQLKSINQQVVVVFGALSGIGRETARRFAERGACVVVVARGRTGLESLVSEIRKRGGEAMAMTADASKFDEVKSPHAPNNLFASLPGYDIVRGDFNAETRRTSLYTWLQKHPTTRLAVVGALSLGLAALLINSMSDLTEKK